VFAVSAVLILALAGCAKTGASASPAEIAPLGVGAVGAVAIPSSLPSTSPSVKPSVTPKPSPSVTPKPSHSPSPSHSAKPSVTQCVTPKHGSFTVASGGSAVAGKAGHLYHYEVQVEDGIGQSASAFAKAVDGTLAGKLGWTDSGTRKFQRVSHGSCDFVVELASAKTSEKICAGYGVDTEGTVSCRGGREVVINVDRWMNGDPEAPWTGHLDVYRHLVVDHEVGHFLGYNHMKCPGAGKPLPVMATPYTTGLNGCVINGWPYTADGTFISGPAQS
jgi:hypothetical protein